MFPNQPPLASHVATRFITIDIYTPWIDLGHRLGLPPFEAKALFVLGTMQRYILSANALLQGMLHQGFLQAFLLMGSCVELLGRCVHTDPSVRQHPTDQSGKRLQAGFEFIKPAHLPPGVIVETNHYPARSGGYTLDDLANLRNLAAHGGSISPAAQVKGDIELLHELRKALLGILMGESDPHRGAGPLPGALDDFCTLLLNGDPDICNKLTDAGVSPVPVQFHDQGWYLDEQIVTHIRRDITDNLSDGLPPISGKHQFNQDHFQLYR